MAIRSVWAAHTELLVAGDQAISCFRYTSQPLFHLFGNASILSVRDIDSVRGVNNGIEILAGGSAVTPTGESSRC
jgi:hypothetical protein